jgi:hypothetical protein
MLFGQSGKELCKLSRHREWILLAGRAKDGVTFFDWESHELLLKRESWEVFVLTNGCRCVI